MSCRRCDYESDDCCIYYEPLTGDWYYSHRTNKWDEVDNDWFYERIYISFCPWCGKELK